MPKKINDEILNAMILSYFKTGNLNPKNSHLKMRKRGEPEKERFQYSVLIVQLKILFIHFKFWQKSFLTFLLLLMLYHVVVAPQLCLMYNLTISYRTLWCHIGNTYVRSKTSFTCYYVPIRQLHAISYLELLPEVSWWGKPQFGGIYWITLIQFNKASRAIISIYLCLKDIFL